MNLKKILLLVLFSFTAYAQDFIPKIEQTLGSKGSWNEKEKVLKISFPRTDVKVSVDGWLLPPFMGLTSWISFISTEDALMAMGDLVLFGDEVNPVMKIALQNGISVTALHNHFFFDNPKVYFMHLSGEGSAESLSIALKRVLDAIKSIRAKNKVPVEGFKGGPIPKKNSISKEIIQNILGVEAQEQNGMVKVVIGRLVKGGEVTIGKEMGINSWAAFAGTNEQAVVDGDIAFKEDELQEVLKVLQDANINIVAIHNHMIQEKPRMLFLHFWGKGKVDDLAKGIKAALAITSLESSNN